MKLDRYSLLKDKQPFITIARIKMELKKNPFVYFVKVFLKMSSYLVTKLLNYTVLPNCHIYTHN